MSENDQCHSNNASMENNTASIIKANSMNHGWFQTIINTVCYYQTPFNVTFVLE